MNKSKPHSCDENCDRWCCGVYGHNFEDSVDERVCFGCGYQPEPEEVPGE